MSRMVVKQVQRYGVMHIPSTRLVEVGFYNRIDAQYSCQVWQSSARDPQEFSVVETSLEEVIGTREFIESVTGRDLEQLTGPVLKEQARPKCPPFVFQSWGYEKGGNGVDHDDVWFAESALKGKGVSLLKRMIGTKSKPVKRSLAVEYAEFILDNPQANKTDKVMFIKRKTGISRSQAHQYIKNQGVKRYYV